MTYAFYKFRFDLRAYTNHVYAVHFDLVKKVCVHNPARRILGKTPIREPSAIFHLHGCCRANLSLVKYKIQRFLEDPNRRVVIIYRPVART